MNGQEAGHGIDDASAWTAAGAGDQGFARRCQFGKNLIPFIVMIWPCFSCTGRISNSGAGISTFPDGSEIAFGVFTADAAEIYSVASDGSQLRLLMGGPVSKGSPSVSRDGQRIAFVMQSEASGQGDIFSMDKDGKSLARLTNSESLEIGPNYSPDGKRIIFARAGRLRPYSMGGKTWDDWDVWLMNEDGTDQRQLTNERYFQMSSPHFSPDGKQVVFAADPRSADKEPQPNQLFIFNLDD